MANSNDTKNSEARTETLRHEESGITIISNYLGNMLEGEQKTLGANDELIQSASFKAGKLDGKFQLFDQKKLKTEQRYQQGKQHGESSYFDAENNKIGTANYAEGERDGITEWKTSEGKVSTRSSYKEGQLDGEQLEFHTNGNLRKKSLYKLGEIQGEVEYFETSGLRTDASRTQRIMQPLRGLFKKMKQIKKES